MRKDRFATTTLKNMGVEDEVDLVEKAKELEDDSGTAPVLRAALERSAEERLAKRRVDAEKMDADNSVYGSQGSSRSQWPLS